MKKLKVFLRGDVYYLHFRHRGKRYFKSMESRDKEVAEQRARSFWREVEAENWAAVDRLRARRASSTIGEVLDCYEQCTTVRASTRQANQAALKLVLREVHGVEDGAVRALSTEVIDGKLARDFQRLRQKRVVDGDRTALLRAGITINSTLRKARSVFSPRAMDLYGGLKLGDVRGFLEAPNLQEVETSYKPVDPEAFKRMCEAAAVLREKDPVLWLVHQHFVRLGLRNSEIAALRKDWMEERGGYTGYAIVHRPGFQPKGKEGFVAIPGDLLEEIKKHEDSAGFVIPAETKTRRYQLIYRDHSNFVKQFFVGRSKTSYELRKHAGSMIAERDGLLAAQAFLRHQSHATTSKYYASALSVVKPIEAVDLASRVS